MGGFCLIDGVNGDGYIQVYDILITRMICPLFFFDIVFNTERVGLAFRPA